MGKGWRNLFMLTMLATTSQADANCHSYLSATQLRAVASPMQKPMVSVLLHSFVTGITVRWNDVEPRTVEVPEDAHGHYNFTHLNLTHTKDFSITIESQNARFPREEYCFALEGQRLSLKISGVQPHYISLKNRRMILAIYAALAMIADVQSFALEFNYIVEPKISRLKALPRVFGALQMVPQSMDPPPAGDEAHLKVEYLRP